MREEKNTLPETIVRNGIEYLLDNQTMTYIPQIGMGMSENEPLGKYAQKILPYLKGHRPIHYQELLKEQLLTLFLQEMDEALTRQEKSIVEQLLQKYPRPNGENFLATVQWRNTVYPIAEAQLMEDFYQQYPPEDRGLLIQQALNTVTTQ